MLPISLISIAALSVWAAPPDLAGPLPGRLRGGYCSGGNRDLLSHVHAVGMNAVMPKFGGIESPLKPADADALRAWSDDCAGQDLAFLPVFNFFGGHEPAWIGDYAHYVDGRGAKLAHTPCPFDPGFWDRYVTARFVAIAEALEGKPFASILLDLEMYGADSTTYREPCYCDACYGAFVRAHADRLKAVPAPERKAAIEAAGLQDEWREAARDRARELATACREALHRVRPGLRIGALHLDLSGPFQDGLALGFGTEKLPVFALTERTYSTGYDEYVQQAQQAFKALGAHVDLLCGVWQSQFPPENLAENLYYCARDSYGYWVYTLETFDAPDYSPLPGKPEDYWAAIRETNAELDRLAADAAYVSRLTVRPFEVPVPPLTARGFKPYALMPYSEEGQPELPPRLRGRNILYFHAKTGDALSFEVTFRQVGRYRDAGRALLVSPAGEELAIADVRADAPGSLEANAAAAGVYGLIIETRANASDVTRASHPLAVGIAGPEGAHLITRVPALYAYVPPGARQATFTLITEGAGEGLHARISSEDGAELYSGDVIGRATATVQLPDDARHVLRFDFAKLPGAVFEDLTLRADEGALPFAATSLRGLLKAADQATR
jgi:hypothetical protein